MATAQPAAASPKTAFLFSWPLPRHRGLPGIVKHTLFGLSGTLSSLHFALERVLTEVILIVKATGLAA